jgi:hypothetical protein
MNQSDRLDGKVSATAQRTGNYRFHPGGQAGETLLRNQILREAQDAEREARRVQKRQQTVSKLGGGTVQDMATAMTNLQGSQKTVTLKTGGGGGRGAAPSEAGRLNTVLKFDEGCRVRRVRRVG